MAKEVVMPQLGITMSEGTLLRWLKQEGEEVEEDEPLFEIESEKAVMEIESSISGILQRILIQEDTTVPVGEVVGIIAEPGEEIAESSQDTGAESEPITEKGERRVKASPVARRIAEENALDLENVKGTGPGGRIVKGDAQRILEEQGPAKEGRVKASPAARRLADEEGIDLADIEGSGPGGRIVTEDIEKKVKARRKPEVALEGETLELGGIRRLTAERMAQSFQTAPHFYLTVEADAQNLVELRREFLPVIEKKNGVRLSFTDLLISFVAKTIRDHPLANAAWQEGEITLYDEINIGLAMATDQGLVVPVIHRADKKSLGEIAEIRHRLVERARNRRLSTEELEGGTFTLTNLGMFDIDTFIPILNPPQSAILGVGSIRERVIAHKGTASVRPTMYLTLSADHRAWDGAMAAEFLRDLRRIIEEPYRQLI